MRTCHYKVRFTYRPIEIDSQPIGERRFGSWIDGYTTARAARAEVERVNERSDRHGVSAEYLGDDRLSRRRYSEQDDFYVRQRA